MKIFDVVIVGAGPAGSLLGYYLALHNISVLIIDKKKLPRKKICGGGLTKRSLDALPFDISEVIETYIRSVSISIDNNLSFFHTSPFPVIGMVMRDNFDYFLLKKAMSHGAELMDETVFKSMTTGSGVLNVETSSGSLKSTILVGADGVYSNVAKALKLNTIHRRMIGLESEIFVDNTTTLNMFMNCARFDFGIIPEGYGWIFPKKDHLSVGVVSLCKRLKGMKQYLYQYLDSKQLSKDSVMKSSQGWMIPYGTAMKPIFANEKGLLVGDAAGLTDPITGEGIFFALKEAEIASRVIVNKLLGKRGLHEYNEAMKPLRNDLIYALKLQKLLYKIPQISYKLMNRHGSKLGKEFIDVITGTTTYSAFYKKLFSLRGIKALLPSIRNKSIM